MAPPPSRKNRRGAHAGVPVVILAPQPLVNGETAAFKGHRMKNQSHAPLTKVLTGIQGFDEITDGGLPRGRTTDGLNTDEATTPGISTIADTWIHVSSSST